MQNKLISPKISIVTPSYNQGVFLEQTIDSVLSQGYENLEYIIIDGGSNDKSVEIIKKYEKHLAYWVSEKDKGQSDAINKGITRSTGAIFNWINSDDYLEPHALNTIGKFFLTSPETNIYAGKCRLFGDYFPTTIRQLGIGACPEDSIINYEMNQPSSFYKLQLIKDFGGLKSTLHYCMDLELWFRYLAKYGHTGIHFSNHLISNFRMHETSKTETSNERFIKDEQQLVFHIANALELPKSILQSIRPEQVYYDPIINWSFEALTKHRFYSVLSKKYLGRIYHDGKKQAARLMLIKLISTGSMKLNRMLFGYLYNLFLKP